MQARLDAIEDWTGARPRSCPWRPLTPVDPFVARVFRAHRWFESGQMALVEPDPSFRLVEGVVFLDGVLKRVKARQEQEEIELAEARRKAAAAGTRRHA